MELLISIMIAVMTACGVYLMLRGRTFPVIVGLTLFTYAVNLFIFVMGRLTAGAPPVIGTSDHYADPLPQALVLTAIVIGFAMTAFVVILAMRARGDLGSDHVNGNRLDDSKEKEDTK